MPTRRRGLRWTREVIASAVLNWYHRHGRLPTNKDWVNAGETHPSSQTVNRVFGDWMSAIECAAEIPDEFGLALRAEISARREDPTFWGANARVATRRAGIRWNQDLIAYAITVWSRRHGRMPTAREWLHAGEDHPSSRTVIRAFGRWEMALAYATQSRDDVRAATLRKSVHHAA